MAKKITLSAVTDDTIKEQNITPENISVRDVRKDAKNNFKGLIKDIERLAKLAGLEVEVDPKLMKAFIDNTAQPGTNKFNGMKIDLNGKADVLPSSIAGTWKLKYELKSINDDGDAKQQKAKIKPLVSEKEIAEIRQQMQDRFVKSVKALSRGEEPPKLTVLKPKKLEELAPKMANKSGVIHTLTIDNGPNPTSGLAHAVNITKARTP